jgi:hypothetical protein
MVIISSLIKVLTESGRFNYPSDVTFRRRSTHTHAQQNMERLTLEVYSDATNSGIVRMPNRQFPGCVIQGDTLHNWLQSIKEIRELIAEPNLGEAADQAAELIDVIAGHVAHYELVLKSHGLKLPY